MTTKELIVYLENLIKENPKLENKQVYIEQCELGDYYGDPCLETNNMILKEHYIEIKNNAINFRND